MRRLSGFVSSALTVSFLAGTAHAHHYIPNALAIEFAPNNPQRVLIGAADFGMFASDDGGANWHLSCYDAFGSGSSSAPSNYSLPLRVTSTGLVLAQISWPLMRSSDGLCTSEELPLESVVEGPRGIGIKRASDGTLFAMTSLGGDENVTELWQADASGESFSRSGVPFVGSFVADSFVLAASPVRTAAPSPIVYVGGYVLLDTDSAEFAIARTDDLGASWNVTEWLPQRLGDEQASRELLATDPGNPGLLFARETVGYDWPRSQQAIWFSRDAGATWRLLHQGQGPVSGFAFSPDGKTLAIGDSIEGLFHVDVASLTNRDTPSSERVFDYPVWAITWNESGLYAGLNEFQPMTEPQFPTVGVSHDGGRTFSPFLSICDVKPSTCDAPSKASSCFESFRDIQVNSQRCPALATGGVGGGAGGASAGSAGGGSGEVSSSGGESASSGGTSSRGGADGGAREPEELRVTSCAMSSPSADSSSTRVVFFMLVAAALGALSRKRESRNQYV